MFTLVPLLLLAFPQQSHILDRPLTWDPIGIVRISKTCSISSQESAWIAEMQQGEFNKVFMDANHKSKSKKPSYLQIWIISESCRKRNATKEFRQVVSDLERKYGRTPEMIFAWLKLASLELSFALASRQGSEIESCRKSILYWTNEADKFLDESVPLSVLVGSVYYGDVLRQRSIADKLVQTNPNNKDLKLWQVRAYLSGSFGQRLGKDGKVLRGTNGRPIVTTYPDSPDIKRAETFLQNYGKSFPDDMRWQFYNARLLSMRAYFLVMDNKGTAQLIQQAKKSIDAFLSSNNMPIPMVEVGKKFRSLPYPGTFNVIPKE